jgi:hypothetical protein
VAFPGGNRLQRAKKLLEDVQAGAVVLATDADDVLDRVTELELSRLPEC